MGLVTCTATSGARAQEPNDTRGSLAEPDDAAEVRAQMELAQKLLASYPDRASVLSFIAASQAHLRETRDALANLKECMKLNAGFDPSGDPVFDELKHSPEFQSMVEEAHRQYPAVAKAKLAFTDPEKDLIPEGLAYDPFRDVFYLSSLHHRKIVQIARNGVISDFVPENRYALLPVLGIRVAPKDATIWANSATDEGKSELLHFAADGQLLGRYTPPSPGKHGLNDLVVLPDGSVITTDSLSNDVYHFNPVTKAFDALKVHRPLIQPNGITLSDDPGIVYFADQLGVVRYDVVKGITTDVEPGPENTLSGVDGLYWYRGGLIAIQNGIGSARIARFSLSKDGRRAGKADVLENRSTFTTLPTTGALRGDEFFFIANSGIDNQNGAKILDPTRLEPVKIGVLKLR